MTDTEFRDAVKKGKLSGGYLLFGDEDFLKNRYAADMCKAVAGDEFAEFNIIKLDAAETSPARLEEALAGYPMMAGLGYCTAQADQPPLILWNPEDC